LLVIDSGVRHALAAGEYALRRAACESAAKKLGVGLLSEAPSESVDRAGLSEEEQRCARHVLGENDRVASAAQCLDTHDFKGFGKAMNASHESLRDDYRVSCAELDAIVEA